MAVLASSASIPPGGSAQIQLTFNSAGQLGEIARVVTVMTSDPRNGQILLHLHGVVVP